MSKNTVESPTFTEVKGDAIELFFKSTTNAIVLHGANCQKVMGSGFAKQIKDQIAPLFYIDQFDTRTNTQRFGSYSAVVIGQVGDHIKIGVNLYTQFNPGAEFDITALRNSLKAFRYSIPVENRAGFTLYLPQIGCGIGGGDWKEVLPVLKKELAGFNVILVDYVPAPAPKQDKK
jgi:O-acetyl-ADP-ribose deacetylase (regulator of RNase III)